MTQRSQLFGINSKLDDHIRAARAIPKDEGSQFIKQLEAMVPLLLERECVAEPQLLIYHEDGDAIEREGWKHMAHSMARQVAYWMVMAKEVGPREVPQEGSE